MYKYTVGVDPGLTGAIALWRCTSYPAPGEIIAVWSVEAESPALVNLKSIAGKFKSADLAALNITGVGVEYPNARPGEGVTSAFNFGATCNGLVGVFLGLGYRVFRIPPQTWHGRMGVKGGQTPEARKAVCAKAAARYPAHADLFFGPGGGARDGLADACFIAEFTERLI